MSYRPTNVPAHEVRLKINALRAGGWKIIDIAAKAGISRWTVRNITESRSYTVHASVAEAIERVWREARR
jgi:hypothetical protein